MDELAGKFEEDIPWGLLPDVLADGILLVKMSTAEFLFGFAKGYFRIKRLSKETENMNCNFGECRKKRK